VRDKPLDKMRGPAQNKTTDDFSTIPGVPAFVAYSLHRRRILTFAQLRAADLRRLPSPAREAIERWRDG